MTVTYTLDVSKSRFSSFGRLLLRWRGSLWKSVYRELLFWLAVYGMLSFIYRRFLDDNQRKVFEDIAEFCFKYTDFIPLTFMLGFFVSLIINRWWDMFNNIGWIDNTAMYVAAYIEGTDDDVRMIRRNIVRYLVLAQAMVFRDISPPIRLRFPTMNALEEGGLLNKAEMTALDSVESPHSKYWLPIYWATSLIKNARQADFVKNDGMVMDLQGRLREFRSGLEKLFCYDWVPVPLVYTQVVFLTVRCYFLMALMGRQYITAHRDLLVESPIDLYFPILTVIQFLFYMGWMKVAEALLNPFGADEDDFEVNYIIDRNLQVGMSMVDSAIGSLPDQEKDKFWFEKHPTPLYSKEMANVAINPAVGSATEIPVREEDTLMVPRVETPAASRQSSRQPSRVSDAWRSMVSCGRKSPNEKDMMATADAAKGAMIGESEDSALASLNVAKSVPSNLQQFEQEKPDLRSTKTAPAELKMTSTASKKSKTEKNKETAQQLSILMEEDEAEARNDATDSKIPLIQYDNAVGI